VDAQGRIKYVLRSMQEGDRKIRVLILRLSSGDEVALAAPWWPDSQDVAVLNRDRERQAEDIVAALIEGTGFTADEVTAVSENSGAARREHRSDVGRRRACPSASLSVTTTRHGRSPGRMGCRSCRFPGVASRRGAPRLDDAGGYGRCSGARPKCSSTAMSSS
jgi:hypothetical protein